MDLTKQFPLTLRALDILGGLGIHVDPPTVLEQISAFRRVCSTWNLSAKLMSKGDLEEQFDAHIADSLTLAPQLHGLPALHYVDIGSGGGFPAIPLAAALPGKSCLMVERSQTKVDYLRQAIRALDAKTLRVSLGQYPCPLDLPVGRIYTARAVEKPEVFDPLLAAALEREDVYLMQRASSLDSIRDTFHVSEITDAFSETGLRRGVLYRVTR